MTILECSFHGTDHPVLDKCGQFLVECIESVYRVGLSVTPSPHVTPCTEHCWNSMMFCVNVRADAEQIVPIQGM